MHAQLAADLQRLGIGDVVHRGQVSFLRDELAEVFECWWDDDDGDVPDFVVANLDLGVKRRTRSGIEQA